MIIQPANYDTTADYLTALDEYFVGDGEVYINKLDYDIDRECERVDYFINILSYQTKSDFADYEPTPGFDDYVPPAALWNIIYNDGSITTYADTTATYSAGDTVTFAVVGLNGADIVAYEIAVTISTPYNTEITQTAQVTFNDSDADYSIVIPADWYGDATVTSVVANTRQEPIYYALSESPYSAGTMTQEVALGVAGSLNDRVVGDVNFDGLITVQDLITVQGRSHDFHGRASHFIKVEGINSTYDPLQTSQNWHYKIKPKENDYTWQTGFGNPVLSGQKKDLTDLTIHETRFEGSTALGQTSYTPTAGDLNADGSLNRTFTFSANGDPVYIFFMISRPLNTATLPAFADQATDNALHISFSTSPPNADSYTDKFELGANQTFYVYGIVGPGNTADTPIVWSNTELPELQSRYKLQGYATSDFSGDIIVEQEFSVEEPASPGDLSLMHSKTIALPNTHARDLYWKPVWSFLRRSNLITLEQLDDSPVDLANIGMLTLSDNYYDPSDPDHQMSVTFTANAGVTASDYEITLTGQDLYPPTSNQNLNTFATGASLASGPWNFARSGFSSGPSSYAPQDRIVIKYSISLA